MQFFSQFFICCSFYHVPFQGLPLLQCVDYFNMCVSVGAPSGKQNHCKLWDKTFIIGNGSYLRKSLGSKVWKGELKSQRKVIHQPWRTGKSGTQASPAARIGLGGAGVQVCGLLALHDGCLCAFTAPLLLAGLGLLLMAEPEGGLDVGWGRMRQTGTYCHVCVYLYLLLPVMTLKL